MKISVLIATHNRSRILRETLEAMARLDRSGIDVEWVVIDNNSTDDTPATIRSFLDRLPLLHLIEPRPGKNCALNRALREAELGDLVVFTDDDITPQPDWLQQIVMASARWPQNAVFGGRILPMWPSGRIPEWAQPRWVQVLGYALHDRGPQDERYPERDFPFGGNMWVRRCIFDAGYRYDEQVGPRPQNRIMGSETTFLAALARDRYQSVYCAGPVVHHRIQPTELQIKAIYRRAYRLGRSEPHLKSYTSVGSREQPQWTCWAKGLGALVIGATRYAGALRSTLKVRRVFRRISALQTIGSAVERLRVQRHPCQGLGLRSPMNAEPKS